MRRPWRSGETIDLVVFIGVSSSRVGITPESVKYSWMDF